MRLLRRYATRNDGQVNFKSLFMKMSQNLLKLLLILLSLSFLFISCDLVKTYSEDEYLDLGKKSSDKKTQSSLESNEIEIKYDPTNINYTILNGDSFDFDDVPLNQRILSLAFAVYNKGTKDLILTGDPIIEINDTTNFTINYSLTKTTIAPKTWTGFYVTFISTATDGNVKNATISIQNNATSSPYTFTIKCSAKASDVVNFYAGTSTWKCPAYNATVTLTLVGGGGGGGGGQGGDTIVGYDGDGGDAGQIFGIILPNVQYNDSFSITVGDGGSGGEGGNTPGYTGISGDLGGSTSVTYNGSVFQANGGSGGKGGGDGSSGDIDGGLGYNNAPAGTDHSGAGGNGGCGGTAEDEYGHIASPGDDGGDGGSGLCIIKWVGFLIQ